MAAITSNVGINITFIKHKNYSMATLKHEAIDRLWPIVGDLPKYKHKFDALLVNFNIDDVLELINVLFRDNDFKFSPHSSVYNAYFDEIEDIIYYMK